MLVIAHRGANQEAIENTWPAFTRAIDAGSQRLEVDVQLSRDEKAYIFHDDTLSRLCGIHRSFADCTSEELARIRLEDGSEIPRLEALISDLLPRVELNIEIKGECLVLSEIVAQQISASPYVDKVVVSCFYPQPLRYLHDTYPHIHTAVLWGYDTVRINPGYFLSPQAFMASCSSRIIHPEVVLVTPGFMEQARFRNWRVYPWISLVDESVDKKEAIWQRLYQLGVDGLCTNWPREFARWQQENIAP